MSSRVSTSARPGARFAQFKLVLLGPSPLRRGHGYPQVKLLTCLQANLPLERLAHYICDMVVASPRANSPLSEFISSTIRQSKILVYSLDRSCDDLEGSIAHGEREHRTSSMIIENPPLEPPF